jgi:uncharacterized membrane protein YfcA
MIDTITLVVLGGAFAGGFVSGLTGFGTGLTTLPIWLYVLTPVTAGPLVIICSLVSQFQTLPAIWHAIDFRRCAPFIAGGLLGVPLGAWLLPQVPVQAFKIAVAALLIGYCLFALIGRSRLRVERGGLLADGLIGLGGGVLGGMAGLAGPLPTIWASLRGWSKDVKRSVFQAFNTSVLIFALISQFATGLVNAGVWHWVLVALPGTICGAWIGRRVYRRLDDSKFEKTVLLILMISGCTLLLGSL